MNKVILYIKDTNDKYQQVDLFEDETISVTSKIQDIRDISKVFTDYSQSFTLPASKKNNKIFRHFYNYYISQGAFDARKKVDAIIEINYIPFRVGKIFLNGVKMKSNSPYAYNVTFFGNTVNLKDLMGDDKLETLTWLDNFEYEYNNTQTKNKFENSVSVTVDGVTKYAPIIVPLITHTKRLFFNSNANTTNTLSGNIHYKSGITTNLRGVQYQDLKPAIRLINIIEAIEHKYGIEFTRDFFHSQAFIGVDTNVTTGLYMWLSREKGEIGSGEATTYTLKNFTHSSGDTLADFTVKNIIPSIEDSGLDNDSVFKVEEWIVGSGTSKITYDVRFSLTITPTSSLPYNLKVIDIANNNEIIAEYNQVTNTQLFSFSPLGTNYSGKISEIKMIVEADSAFSATTSLKITQIEDIAKGIDSVIAEGIYTSDNISTITKIVPTDRIPDLKIIDFINGIFKMFNLTAYYIDDLKDADYGKIKVISLDDYYADNPRIFDITKYTDSSETDIEATIPFSEIEFKYKEPKTLLMLKHKETFNDIFGNSDYKPQDVDRGKPYKVEVPFEHIKYERLLDDANTTVSTDIMWGYSAGDNFKPDANAVPKTGDYDSVLTQPLLFYAKQLTLFSGQTISWLNQNISYEVDSYWMPSNAVNLGTTEIAPIIDGTTTATVAGYLYDSSEYFDSSFLHEGCIVKNVTTGFYTKLKSVVSIYQLELEDDIFVSGNDYLIFCPPKFTINFDAEFDEWTRENYNINSNSLFSDFYQTYIEDAFNPKKRIFKIKAHLPNSILLNYKLNDRFQINDKVFTINSIDTNLKTGESNLELLNVL